MPHVYLLSEDDFDEAVYANVVEVLLGHQVTRASVLLRKGGGIGEVRKKLPLLLSMVRRSGSVDDTYLVIGLDSDRAPQHPAHEALSHTEQKGCRHCYLDNALAEGLPDGWPIPCAFAVPVEMIESWLLLMHAPERYRSEAELPVCARSDQEAARRIYGASPPPQLKELLTREQEASDAASKSDFGFLCVLRLEPEDLASRSPSFARFRDQVHAWGHG